LSVARDPPRARATATRGSHRGSSCVVKTMTRRNVQQWKEHGNESERIDDD
jgi:hypothetical protein